MGIFSLFTSLLVVVVAVVAAPGVLAADVDVAFIVECCCC